MPELVPIYVHVEYRAYWLLYLYPDVCGYSKVDDPWVGSIYSYVGESRKLIFPLCNSRAYNQLVILTYYAYLVYNSVYVRYQGHVSVFT